MRLVVGPNVVFFILVIMVIEVIVVMTYFNENIVLFIGNLFKITMICKTTMITAISMITKISMINTIGSVYMLVSSGLVLFSIEQFRAFWNNQTYKRDGWD